MFPNLLVAIVLFLFRYKRNAAVVSDGVHSLCVSHFFSLLDFFIQQVHISVFVLFCVLYLVALIHFPFDSLYILNVIGHHLR